VRFEFIWISGTGGREVPKFMVRKFNSVPKITMQFVWFIICRVIEWENELRILRLNGWLWNMFLFLVVVMSRVSDRSVRVSIVFFVSARWVPCPATMIGFLFARSTSVAAAIVCARGVAGLRGAGMVRCVAVGVSIFVCCMLVGSSSAVVVFCSVAVIVSVKVVRVAVPDVVTKVCSSVACNTPVVLKFL